MQVNYRELKKNSPLTSQEFDFMTGELLNFSPEKLFNLADSIELDTKQINKIKKIEALFKSGTPLPYIFKKVYFCSNEFYVDKNVLIPRPETEILLREAIKFLELRTKNREYSEKTAILDLGTGSGCIIISIYKILNSFFPEYDSSLHASDISSTALKIANKNAKSHGVNIDFIKSNLFANIHGRFDLICANLPYIDPSDPDINQVADPKIALNGGKDGFEKIESAVIELPRYLNTDGLAIFEIGYNQDNLIKKSVKSVGFSCTIKKDFNNFPRIALITK